ncbi:MAG: ATP-dependent RecD-like DNA helicase [Lachnospiraceae bacterium]|nr:ATP-dependent RecD-like DNA helicase [Lachnospiraceae bacterium]
MEVLSGYIDQIIFRIEETGYTVFSLSTEAEEVTCVGTFRYADEGEMIEVTGEYTTHRTYGRQFSVKSYETKAPTTVVTIERYLASGAIKGIGPAMAKRIVKEFGDKTLEIMESEPERLIVIKGITENKARDISLQINEKKDFREVLVFLQRYGVSLSLANKIYDKYGLESYRVIAENPYILAEDISGVGFKKADEIAARAGIKVNSDYRIRCGILYVLSDAVSKGHCYLPKDELLLRAEYLLSVDKDIIFTQVMNLYVDKKLIVSEQYDEVRIYTNIFYFTEASVARMLSDLSVKLDSDEDAIIERIDKLSDKEGIVLDDLQKEAIVNAVSNGVAVITGGPGTGKTTIINLIIKYIESLSLDFYLAAPTGRAAKRMTETTGYEASTIQRLLHLNPSMGEDMKGFVFEKNEDDPLEADVIIIDEMSMVDIQLFNALLKAISIGTRLVLVGDTNQLPSVGPGSVLKDIIKSNAFPVVCLQKIFRQDEASDIVINAHEINSGNHIRLDNKSKDFFFLRRNNEQAIMSDIIKYITGNLPSYVGADPLDIQVLTPMRRGPLGVEGLNPYLQKHLNPPSVDKLEKEYGDTLFREGDKVMHIKNNYQLEWEIKTQKGVVIEEGVGVFNGDTGVIKDINTVLETVTVEYEEGKTVKYPYSLLDELELAYAITIHKSQGSEYPAVIIPILSGPKMLFSRNLLYTAVTRAKSTVLILGSDTQVFEMIDNSDEQKRYTSLSDRIIEIGGI